MRAFRKEGARECRVLGAPAAPCARGGSKKHTSIHSEVTGTSRHSRTQWFYGLYVLSSEIGLSCLRRLADLSAKLGASVEASGPHDLAVRISAARHRPIRVHRIPRSTSVTIAIRPSSEAGRLRIWG
jgi:hypothetical protein